MFTIYNTKSITKKDFDTLVNNFSEESDFYIKPFLLERSNSINIQNSIITPEYPDIIKELLESYTFSSIILVYHLCILSSTYFDINTFCECIDFSVEKQISNHWYIINNDKFYKLFIYQEIHDDVKKLVVIPFSDKNCAIIQPAELKEKLLLQENFLEKLLPVLIEEYLLLQDDEVVYV